MLVILQKVFQPLLRFNDNFNVFPRRESPMLCIKKRSLYKRKIVSTSVIGSDWYLLKQLIICIHNPFNKRIGARGDYRHWNKHTTRSGNPVVQCAFKDLMIHWVLQFALRIAFRCVLHRCGNQDIHRLKLLKFIVVINFKKFSKENLNCEKCLCDLKNCFRVMHEIMQQFDNVWVFGSVW